MNPPNDRIWVGSWSQCHHHGNCQVTWDLPADYGRDIIRQSQHREVGDGGPAVSSAVLTFRMSDQRGSQRWQNCLHVFTVTLQLQTSYCAERQPVPSLFSVLLLSGHITVIWCSIYDAAFHSCVISQSTKVWNGDLIITYNYNMISCLPFQAAVVNYCFIITTSSHKYGSSTTEWQQQLSCSFCFIGIQNVVNHIES